MSSGPELPVIYENPRFDKATPTLKPVIDRAVRFTGVILMEWGTLTLIEESPRYLKVATIIVAGLVLAVHESWPWLHMRNKRWYPSLMVTLVAGYLGLFFYALTTEPPHKTGAQQITSPAASEPPPAPLPKLALTAGEDEALKGLAAILNGKGRQALKLSAQFLPNIHPLGGGIDAPAMLRDKALELAEVLSAMETELYREFLPTNTYYRTELLAALGTDSVESVESHPPYRLSQTMQRFANRMQSYIGIVDEAKNERVTNMVVGLRTESYGEINEANSKFKSWIDDGNERIQRRKAQK
jgi:hypothetical protein